MLKFKQFDMADKEVFEMYMKGKGYIHSEASFANMFMLAKAGKFCISYDDQALYIIQDWEDYTPFMLPPYPLNNEVDMKSCLEKACEYMQSKYGKIYFKFITPELAELIKNSGFEFKGFEYDADNSEYLYDAKALIELKGKKYHAKRNHLKKFVNNFDHELIIYDEKYKNDCLKIHDEWISVRPYSYDEECERVALERALDNFDKLSLMGCIVKADGKPVGFSFAERITDKHRHNRLCIFQDG